MLDVGVDVGGTFTDLVAVDRETGALHLAKVPSTPGNQAEGFLQALAAGVAAAGAVATLVHGSTVATNTILERKGARCGLIATRGFRDVLELRRRDRPHLYGLTGSFEPLIPRERRLEVTERLDTRGAVVEPLAVDEVRAAAASLRAQGVEVVVVSFLHAYANPDHERQARAILAECLPDTYIVLASEVLPELREFERTSTAVVNGYVQPVMDRYLGSLERQLGAAGYGAKLLLVQSNGGVMAAAHARRFPVNTVLSGPAAGVMAGSWLAGLAGYRQAITCDMGGTSFDVALVVDGQPRFGEEQQVEFGVPVRLPHVDMVTIGAGGGSIAWIDRGGLLRVGPRSAGAEPGPACYGRGGTEPTVTDAQLALGRLDAGHALGSAGALRLDAELARAAIGRAVARPLGVDVPAAAEAILAVANSRLAASIRSVSVERGHDPRECVLVVFGGAGPLHAGALLREVGVPRALIPPHPGVTSALGCVVADFRHDFVQTLTAPVAAVDEARLQRILAEQAAAGRALLDAEGVPPTAVTVLHEADLAYEGQLHTVRAAIPPTAYRADLAAAFDRVYAATYGHLLAGFPVMLLAVRTTVVGKRGDLTPRPPSLEGKGVPGADLPASAESGAGSRHAGGLASPLPSKERGGWGGLGPRPVRFRGEWVDCPVYERGRLAPEARLAGPAVVVQADSTVLVEPGMQAWVDAGGNLILAWEA